MGINFLGIHSQNWTTADGKYQQRWVYISNFLNFSPKSGFVTVEGNLEAQGCNPWHAPTKNRWCRVVSDSQNFGLSYISVEDFSYHRWAQKWITGVWLGIALRVSYQYISNQLLFAMLFLPTSGLSKNTSVRRSAVQFFSGTGIWK